MTRSDWGWTGVILFVAALLVGAILVGCEDDIVRVQVPVEIIRDTVIEVRWDTVTLTQTDTFVVWRTDTLHTQWVDTVYLTRVDTVRVTDTVRCAFDGPRLVCP